MSTESPRLTAIWRPDGPAAGPLLHVWQGMLHVFPANVALLQATREALAITGEFLRSNLGR